MSVPLTQLFSGIACQRISSHDQTVSIQTIVTDSRRAGTGCLFVALPGQRTDGLLFVRDAVARGAAAVLADSLPDAALRAAAQDVPWICAPNPRALLPELAARLYRFPAKEATLHAVTGTNGKTTTVYMLAHLLAGMGRNVAFWSTNSVEGIAEPFRPSMTTPDPPDLHQFLREACDRGAEDILLEISSHALQLGRIDGLRFKTAGFTNITPDHLDFHGTFERYREVKARLLRYVEPDGVVALNADDLNIASLASESSAAVSLYGMGPDADVRAEILDLGVDFSRWRWFHHGRYAGEVRLTVPGVHNVMNALSAIAMALHMGLDAEEASRALGDFAPAPRRLETVQLEDFTIVSDVAMNRGSYDAVMQSVAAAARPVVVVNAIRGNRGVEVNRDIADVLADWNERLRFAPVVATLSETRISRLSVDYWVRPEEQMAFMDSAHRRGLAVDMHSELEDAIDAAIGRLPHGGVLLLLGTFGMDDGMAVAQKKLQVQGIPAANQRPS